MSAFLRSTTVVLSVVAMLAMVACTVDTAEQDATNAFITVVALQGAAAAIDATPSDALFSDVCDNEAGPDGFPIQCVAVNDFGVVTMRADPKNLAPSLGVGPFSNVTFTRYRVSFIRSDGRNTPGVDVPYGFDGVMNLFVGVGGEGVAAFTIVRQQAKLEPPLRNLAGNGGVILISTVAQVEFYGTDGAGRPIMARGDLSVTFGDF